MKDNRSCRVLIVDDEESICEVLSIALEDEGFDTKICTDPLRALELLKIEGFQIVLVDIKMPRLDGLEFIRRAKGIKPELVVLVMTAYSTWDKAVEAMRIGAFTYIKKPFDMDLDIRSSVNRASRLIELRQRTHKELKDIMESSGYMIGASPQMQRLYDLIHRAAPTDATVLIQGESGVGKELVARALHHGSTRQGKPFVTINCAAFVETLLESELFGHTKGAFTGAHADKVGLLEVADKGTFFLDEISEMSPRLQTKFLRVLEEKEYKPVGSHTVKKVDVRFIAATNKDILEEVKRGHFRSDLFYRLNVIPLNVPPLRERKEDIPLLAGFFLSKFSKTFHKEIRGFTPRAQEALMEYDWPGNIRELENVIQKAMLMAKAERIDEVDLFESIRVNPTTEIRQVEPLVSEKGVDLGEILAQTEREYLRTALELAQGNYTKAAKLLRLSLRSFRYKLQKYGLG
jgi:two-component system response regulator PilR (NtrC family)